MKTERQPRLTPPMRAAVLELEGLVRQQYPDASFRIMRSPDDERSVDVVTTVDLDDPDAVMDLVVDRVMELQIEQKLPIHVVPVRTPERTAKLHAEQREQRHSVGHMPVEVHVPQP